MSSASDLLPVTELAWKLYCTCYTVSPTALPALQVLLPELSGLAQSNYLLYREAQDVTSTLLCSGEDWIAKVKGLLARVETTLWELKHQMQRYDSGGDTARTKWGQMVDWVKVVIGGWDPEKFREKVGVGSHFTTGSLVFCFTPVESKFSHPSHRGNYYPATR